jgi:hypothetical protein
MSDHTDDVEYGATETSDHVRKFEFERNVHDWWERFKGRVQKSWVRGVGFVDDVRRHVARLVDPDSTPAAMFTYFVALPTPKEKYGPGERGVAQVICNTPYQIIDVVCACKAATFNLTGFYVGDANMFLGCAAISADAFAPAVQNRFVRFTTLQRGQTVQVPFENISSSGEPEMFNIYLKVRSERHC